MLESKTAAELIAYVDAVVDLIVFFLERRVVPVADHIVFFVTRLVAVALEVLVLLSSRTFGFDLVFSLACWLRRHRRITVWVLLSPNRLDVTSSSTSLDDIVAVQVVLSLSR